MPPIEGSGASSGDVTALHGILLTSFAPHSIWWQYCSTAGMSARPQDSDGPCLFVQICPVQAVPHRHHSLSSCDGGTSAIGALRT